MTFHKKVQINLSFSPISDPYSLLALWKTSSPSMIPHTYHDGRQSAALWHTPASLYIHSKIPVIFGAFWKDSIDGTRWNARTNSLPSSCLSNLLKKYTLKPPALSS
jgi:hypothetical protein